MSVVTVEPGSVPARRVPDLIGPNAIPGGAVTWQSPAERQRLLNAWRQAVLLAFNRDARVIKVAWIIRDLMEGGYCYASDRYISQQSGVPLNKVAVALADLERAGAIVRATTLKGRERERRIWAASRIMPDPPPAAGGQNNKGQRARTHSPLGASTALSNAALDAELRRRREAGQPMPWNEGLPALTD